MGGFRDQAVDATRRGFRGACRWAVTLALSALASAALAESYPSRPVQIIVPFPAGTSTDVVGREVAHLLSKANDATFIVENRPGAQGIIGARVGARATQDGYTLFLGNNTTQAAAPYLMKDLKYDPSRDFEPIARIGVVVLVLAVRPTLPVTSVEQLIEYGKAHPGQLRWGYANSANQVSGAAVARIGGFEAVSVPYKGVPQMTMDLVGGVIDFMVSDVTNTVPMINAGKLRALAVTSTNRIAALPDAPPLAQSLNGFTLLGWYGLFAPAGTPSAITAKLSQQLLSGLADPEVQELLKRAGIIPYPGTPDELRAFVATESAKWAELIKNAGIALE
jgi:tripartite-type tricarboxylate transporter receptor subunit TctC